MTKRDLEIIEHAINVSHTHGGSINLHKAFQFVHGLFSKKKSKPKESEPIYYGYDPKSTKAPPHESTYTKKTEEPKKAPKYEEPKQEYTKRPPPLTSGNQRQIRTFRPSIHTNHFQNSQKIKFSRSLYK
jgi:hypothetical protein